MRNSAVGWQSQEAGHLCPVRGETSGSGHSVSSERQRQWIRWFKSEENIDNQDKELRLLLSNQNNVVELTPKTSTVAMLKVI